MKRPRQWLWGQDELYEREPRTMIIEEQDRDLWTGLYDKDGRKLMREPQPFGFRVRK